MTSLPLISVIVPVYKVEPYLDRCVQSIVSQTYDRLEILLIDDGSPDRCPEMCDEWAKRDPRIRVIHKENQGVSAARNQGIAEATGKYTAFVDSDDYIHPQMLEILCFAMESTDYPFIHCAFHRTKTGEPDKPAQEYRCTLDQLTELTAEQGMLKMMDWKEYGHYIWKGLYGTDYIRPIRFPLNTRWEDVIWSGIVVGKAGKYGYIPVDLYAYVSHDTSLVHTYSWDVQQYYFFALRQYVDLARQLTPTAAEQVEIAVFKAIIDREFTLENKKTLDKNARKEIQRSAKYCRLTLLKLFRSDCDFRRKALMFVCMISFPIGCGVRRKLIK